MKYTAAIACVALLAGCLTHAAAQTQRPPAPSPAAAPTATAADRPVIAVADQTMIALRAESSNAMGVTGNIQFYSDRIEFATGAKLSIREVAPKVYRVTKQLDRKLVEGNTLCGRSAVQYITLHTDPAGLYLLNIVTEDRQPATPRPDEFLIDGTCAVYVYARTN